jgi:hypothetical protein
MGRVVSTSEARIALNPEHPKLTDENFTVTSPETWEYNCIAWAAGDANRWWWPGNEHTYWPISDEVTEIESFVRAFGLLGYAVTSEASDPRMFECVAIYAKDGIPTHAARQLEDGQWTSKLGRMWDISHEHDALNDGVYGKPALLMRRAR